MLTVIRVRILLDGTNDGSDWTDEEDNRRCELIDNDIAGTFTVEERVELADLERQANAYFDATAAPPMDDACQLHQALLSRGA